jgi:transcriptional regulator with XRE-family HTH domain
MTGKTLRRIRTQLGLTQQAFAEQIGVTGNSVARWERDEMRMRESAVRLVTLLGKSASSSTRKGRR